jgi:hypothetical protein
VVFGTKTIRTGEIGRKEGRCPALRSTTHYHAESIDAPTAASPPETRHLDAFSALLPFGVGQENAGTLADASTSERMFIWRLIRHFCNDTPQLPLILSS